MARLSAVSAAVGAVLLLTLGGCPRPGAPDVTWFAVNGGDASTSTRAVVLNSTCSGGPTQYRASETAGFGDSAWEDYATEVSFELSEGEGSKTVHFQVRNASGQSSSVSDSITVSASDGGDVTDDLVFIHHSVGENWLAHSLDDALLAKTYIDECNDITYGTDIAPDAGRPDSLGPVPGDLTDMHQWVLWFNDYLGRVMTHGCADGVNRIVMFKSCFPNSHIDDAGTEPGDPFSDWRTVANYRAVYRHPDGPGNTYLHEGHVYHPLEDVFAANPDVLFIVVTAPPECWADTTADVASRARTFNNWLKDVWRDDYAANTGLQNVAVFDLFDVLANPCASTTHPNQLRAAYGGDSGDSHPNDAGNAAATSAFATGTGNLLDAAWGDFDDDSR